MTFISLSLILYFIMDPVGNIASFLSQTEKFTPSKQRAIIFREMFFALALMLIVNVIGEYLFSILSISEVTVRLSSGVILFIAAFQILFPGLNSLRRNLPDCEPFLTPLAIPLIAGPSVLATIMLFAHTEESFFIMVAAICLSWVFALVTLLLGKKLQDLIGNNGLSALERLMGMILILLAIQRFMSGILLFIQTN